MFRIILIAGILGAAYLITKLVMSLLTANNCKDCFGEGYWVGTRGDRNTCHTCSGTGKKNR